MSEEEQRAREAARHDLLEGDIMQLAITLITAAEKGPTEHLVPAAMALLVLGRPERAKRLFEIFLETFSDSHRVLKEGVEYELALKIHYSMVDPARLQPVVDLCKELGIIVRMPDPDESAIIVI